MKKKHLAPIRSPEERNKIVEANLPLVPWAYKCFLQRNPMMARLQWEDAFQAGYLGLLEAADYWDPAKGKFSTYARFYLRKTMYEAANQKLLRVPNRDRKEIRERQERMESEKPKRGRPRLAAQLPPLPSVQRMPDSFDPPAPVATVPDIVSFAWDKVRPMLDWLDPVLSETILLYYFEGMSLPTIALKHNVTSQCVQQRFQRALSQLREWSRDLELP